MELYEIDWKLEMASTYFGCTLKPFVVEVYWLFMYRNVYWYTASIQEVYIWPHMSVLN